MDFKDGVLYRMAYGLAVRLAESGAGAENFPGRLRSNAAAGGDGPDIPSEPCR
jgi:hypothetical protein